MVECIICQEVIEAELRRLECSHTFHSGCINRWFIYSLTCPICRFRVDLDISELIMIHHIQRLYSGARSATSESTTEEETDSEEEDESGAPSRSSELRSSGDETN